VEVESKIPHKQASMSVSYNIDRAWPLGRRRIVAFLGALCLMPAASLSAQTSQGAGATDVLHQLNKSIEALVRRVSPSVVQIVVTGYRSTEQSNRGQADVVIGRERAIGSGVIVDPKGYIVTNAHVLTGAQQIEVIVPSPGTASAPPDADARGKSYQARVIGVTREIDLAVLKIDANGLPALPIRASILPSQGEMVFAFGSPEGLRNTVTMGVISSVARQPDPDSPLVYVQTDTPINPGNSGGPLVDADGGLLGINTFILSTSGGNQGLGFAIPAGELAFAYPQLVKYGHIHQPEIGAIIQTITPELAAGLRLQKDVGVIVSDVVPGGPADTAGLKIQDIILSVDGTPTGNLPLFTHSLYLHGSGERAKIEVLRGANRLQLDVPLVERPHKSDSLVETADPVKNLVGPLGILGIELNLDLAKDLPDLRIPTGVIVAAKTLGAEDGDVPLETGDVIHALNGISITTLAGLRDALAMLKPGDAVALLIERFGQLIYVSFLR
jgi:serine protease Do